MRNPNPTPELTRFYCEEGKRIKARSNFLADASGEVSDEMLVIKELDEHVNALAKSYNVTPRIYDGPLSAIPCAYYASLQCVHIPRVVGPLTYFCALHEIGHAALNRPGGQTAEETLQEERDAWEWAFKEARLTPSEQVVEYREAALDHYRHACVCNICGKWVEVKRGDEPAVIE